MGQPYFQARSIKRKWKHGEYSAEGHSEMYSTQYMKRIRKLQELLIPE